MNTTMKATLVALALLGFQVSPAHAQMSMLGVEPQAPDPEPQAPAVEPAPAPPPAEPAEITFTNEYSRGNDDNAERDEAGVQNYQTATIGIHLVAKPRDNGDIVVELRYAGELTTDEGQAVRAVQNFGLLEARNTITDARQAYRPFDVTVARRAGNVIAGTTFTRTVELGTLRRGMRNGRYSGTLGVGTEAGGLRQAITWNLEIADGAVVRRGSGATLYEAPTRERTAAEMIYLVQSTLDPAPTTRKPHPRRQGRTRGVGRVG
jgi:hypothetical protein